jgi:hypothetical protein
MDLLIALGAESSILDLNVPRGERKPVVRKAVVKNAPAAAKKPAAKKGTK